MSTKIYNGIKFVELDIIALDKKVKEELRPLVTEHVKNTLREVATKAKDEGKNPFNHLKVLYDDYLENSRKMTVSMGDIDYNLSVFFHNGELYGQFFSGLRNSFDIKELSWVKDFHYQNQVGEPDDVEYEDFEARGVVWDAILGKSGIPALVGWNIKVIDTSTIYYDLFKELRNKK